MIAEELIMWHFDGRCESRPLFFITWSSCVTSKPFLLYCQLNRKHVTVSHKPRGNKKLLRTFCNATTMGRVFRARSLSKFKAFQLFYVLVKVFADQSSPF